MQSGRLPLVEQIPREKIGGGSALESSAAIGLDGGHIVVKLHGRMLIAEGSRKVGKFICH